MKSRKIISLFISFAMLITVLAGCAKEAPKEAPKADAAAATTVTTAAEFKYPVPGNVKLTYFGQLHKKVMSKYSTYADLPVVQKWFKETGVTLDFHTPAAGMEKEQYNILLASGDLPDIINYNLAQEPGGFQKLFDDKVIIKLTKPLKDYAPNLTKFYKDNPNMERMVKDDNGDHFVFPFLKGGGYLLATTGPMLRGDILKKLGLKEPETIAEWDTVLQAFKKDNPKASPFLSSWENMTACFQPAFGVSNQNWYADSAGKVHFAPMEDGYKQFITQLNKWYTSGLIDANFATLDASAIDNAVSAGAALATHGAGSSSLGAYMNANKKNPEYSVIGVHLPTMNKGEKAKYATEYEFGGNPQVGISTKCKNVEAAVRMYDWGFSKEANLLLNWGTEGESFTYNDKKEPQYTDKILKDPDGVDLALARYAMTHIKGPAMLVQDPRYMLQYYSMPQQQQAMKAWTEKDFNTRIFPPVSYTSKESSDLTRTLADLNTYVQSMSLKFIFGTEPLSNWDKFVSTIKSMNVDNAMKIQQDAVTRYNKR